MICNDMQYVTEALWQWVLYKEERGPMPANMVTWHAVKLYRRGG